MHRNKCVVQVPVSSTHVYVIYAHWLNNNNDDDDDDDDGDDNNNNNNSGIL